MALTLPRSRSSLHPFITTGPEVPATDMPGLLATYLLAWSIRIPQATCIHATRSPAARIPPIPEVMPGAPAMSNGPPTPVYSPARRPISTRAVEALDGTPTRGVRGNPPTPMVGRGLRRAMERGPEAVAIGPTLPVSERSGAALRSPTDVKSRTSRRALQTCPCGEGPSHRRDTFGNV